MKRLLAPTLVLSALALVAGARGVMIGTAHAQLPPERFFGAVMMNGQPAPAGTEVKAYIGSADCGTAYSTDDGRYVLDVLSNTDDAPGCGDDDAPITFTIAGVTVTQSGSFQRGYFFQLDLSLDTPSDVPSPSDQPQPAPSDGENPPPAEPEPAPEGG